MKISATEKKALKKLERGYQKQLMELTGIKSQSHMSNVLNGNVGTTVGNLKKIRDFITKKSK